MQPVANNRWSSVLRSFTHKFLTAALFTFPLIFSVLTLKAQDTHFHNAPPSSAQEKNPYGWQHAAIAAGAKLYTMNCGSCHGNNGRGTGNIPALSHGPTQSAPDGEVRAVKTSRAGAAISRYMPVKGCFSPSGP